MRLRIFAALALLGTTTAAVASVSVTAAEHYGLSELCRADELVAYADAEEALFAAFDRHTAQQTYRAVVATVAKADLKCFGSRAKQARASIVHGVVAHRQCKISYGCDQTKWDHLTAYAERDFLRAGWVHVNR